MVKIEVTREIAEKIQQEISQHEELFGGEWTPSKILSQWIVRYEDQEVHY